MGHLFVPALLLVGAASLAVRTCGTAAVARPPALQREAPERPLPRIEPPATVSARG
ncbi:hypothetical protein [Corallococcus macrosporus]|uniref:Uncharacterized protein n=2 Tax=Myxococcaceae TaxID=31 RepID=A0A286NW62_9BACT|nr:hypothetical protein [Corallococcus macrosporus]AEI63841.1 hypothetical protein LILAB_09650 [Corallococcus macrosporus]ATB51407.1 hypothetical protein MYMAC_007070 [Corallococcus macrosporus DSM 14697]